MATLRKEIVTQAQAPDVWAAIEDIGALHTRLVPGFVTATRLEPGARVVTFANGMTVREPIVSIDPAAMRLVWTAESQLTSHYNAAVQVFAGSGGESRVVWTVDLLPDDAGAKIEPMMAAGMRAMQKALDSLALTRSHRSLQLIRLAQTKVMRPPPHQNFWTAEASIPCFNAGCRLRRVMTSVLQPSTRAAASLMSMSWNSPSEPSG